MKRSILLVLSLAFIYVTLTSNSNGIAVIGENRTGAGGSSANCTGSGCHPANNTDLNISIIMINIANGDTITSGTYEVGKSYRILLSGSYAAGGFPFFGFQFTATRDNGLGAGDFILTSTGIQTAVVAPYQIVEHAHPLAASGSFNQRYETWFNWYPSAPYGNVKFWATMMAADGNGFANGDITNSETRIITQEPLSVASLNDEIRTSIYPNPVRDQLNISISNAGSGTYRVEAVDMHGQILESKIMGGAGAGFETKINTASWASGTYFIRIKNNSASRIIPVVRQ